VESKLENQKQDLVKAKSNLICSEIFLKWHFKRQFKRKHLRLVLLLVSVSTEKFRLILIVPIFMITSWYFRGKNDCNLLLYLTVLNMFLKLSGGAIAR